jgi:hypothetical protein
MPCCCKSKGDSGQISKVHFRTARRTAGRVTVRKHFWQAKGSFVIIRANTISTTLTDGKTTSANVNARNVFPKMLVAIQEYIHCSG